MTDAGCPRTGEDGGVAATDAEITDKVGNVPEAWRALLIRLQSEAPSRVFILGLAATGKTNLATYLLEQLRNDGRDVAILDADPAQGELGLPATLSLLPALKSVPGEESGEAYFLGAYAPALHLARTVTGLRRLIDRNQRRYQMVIVDSCSFVQGDGGRLLQGLLLELLAPDIVVVMQRHRELEHLVAGVLPDRVVRLDAVVDSIPPTPEQGREARERSWHKYFGAARTREYDWSVLRFARCFLGSGETLTEELPLTENLLHLEKLSGWEGCLAVSIRTLAPGLINELSKRYGRVRNIIAGREQGMLVGLADESDGLLGLGIIEKIDYRRKKVRVLTPILDWCRVRVMQCGSVRLNPKGQEIGFVEPGYF